MKRDDSDPADTGSRETDATHSQNATEDTTESTDALPTEVLRMIRAAVQAQYWSELTDYDGVRIEALDGGAGPDRNASANNATDSNR